MRRVWWAAVLLAVAPAPARAQTSNNAAGAEALYEQARGLMKQGDFAQACPKFKQSYELDAGGGTLLNLAECYEKQGKLASAWSTFREALVVAQRDGRKERVEYAKKHLADIEPQVPKIIIEVPSEANEPELTVTLDGAPLGAAAWGVGMPVDAGEHRVTANAPHRAGYEQRVEISIGSRTLRIPRLSTSAGTAQRIDDDVEKKPVREEHDESGRRTVGWIVGGTGVLALGVGTYFGLNALIKWNERKDGCVAGCTGAAKTAGDDAKSAALLSNIGFGVGLVAVGVGTYLVLSSGSSAERSGARARSVRAARTFQLLPAVGPTGAGLLLRGAY
jgi:hypothetical protein